MIGHSIQADRIRELMRETVELAARSIAEDERPHPLVGALLADFNGNVLETAFRGETGPGHHAEYVVLNKAMQNNRDFNTSILFVTLEPCTTRGPGKTPCAKRIIDCGIRHVYVGTLDPNKHIRGDGELTLQLSGITVERFAPDLQEWLRLINEPFFTYYRNHDLPPESLYVRMRIPELIRDYLRENGVQVDPLPEDWDITLQDIIGYCEPFCTEEQVRALPRLLDDARSLAYDRKYADYSYQNDARGHNISWAAEVHDLLSELGMADYIKKNIIDVGVGNGLELPDLFREAQHLTIVDIARDSLSKAVNQMDRAEAIVAPAEDIGQYVAPESMDIYVSLRTFQSTYFDVKKAIREMQKILKKGGIFVISVSNGFIGPAGKLIPGLMIPKTSLVDESHPFSLATMIHERLTFYGFKDVKVRTGQAEIYIYGKRGR